MYNRYIQNDVGVYERIPRHEPPPPSAVTNDVSEKHPPQARKGIVSDILAKFRLEEIDTGDLLLLVILFLLFRDGEDEELLIALGLLLIL